MGKKLVPLPKTVKETVDFIYEYLIEHPDGLVFPMREIVETRTQQRVISILVKRGIIEKKSVPTDGKYGASYRYKWVANMPPTKTLYGSIVTEIRNEQNNWPSWKKKKKTADPQTKIEENTDELVPPICEQEETQQTVFNGFAPLDGFSDQELWDELKKRGYTIEDNRLVIIKKAYLN